MALSASAHAVTTLENYFNFTSYGTVTAGNTVAAVGNTGSSATVKATGTTLTSSGLAITAGSLGASTGVTMASTTLIGFTGDFTLQMWYTTPGTVAGNTALFGGTSSATVDGSMVGDQGFFAAYSNTNPRFVRPIVGNNTQFGVAGAPPAGTGGTGSTLYDYVITYSSLTSTFTAYLNGTQVGNSFSVPFFGGLDDLTNGFAIGGVQNPAFNDNAAGVNITSFMMYSGTLTAGEVSSIHAFGSTPTLNQLGSVVAVPEPSALALLGLGLLGGLRRRR
ncbi:hypothetical protein llg_42540 [Luteolibacter sp. LG18]|nr:hypothetical protein llg_42540 [Luteolibacter sp. LG18]